MTGPLVEIMQAFDRGVRSVPAIAAATGLDRDLVAAGVDHLVASGRMSAMPSASGCPTSACGGCALLARGCGGASGGLGLVHSVRRAMVRR